MKKTIKVWASIFSSTFIVFFVTFVVASLIISSGAMYKVFALHGENLNIDYVGSVSGITNSEEVVPSINGNTLADNSGSGFDWEIGDMKMFSSGNIPVVITITLTNKCYRSKNVTIVPPESNGNLNYAFRVDGQSFSVQDSYVLEYNSPKTLEFEISVIDVTKAIYKADISFDIEIN